MKRGYSLVEIMICGLIILTLSALSFKGLRGMYVNTRKVQMEVGANARLIGQGEKIYDKYGHLIQPNKPMYVNGIVMTTQDGEIITKEMFYIHGIRP